MKHGGLHPSAPSGKPGDSNDQNRKATCTGTHKDTGQEATDRRISRTFERSLYSLHGLEPSFVPKFLPETFELESVISTIFSSCLNEIILIIFPEGLLSSRKTGCGTEPRGRGRRKSGVVHLRQQEWIKQCLHASCDARVRHCSLKITLERGFDYVG